ncbi:hypothetical protein MLD38_005142 [Melastoma candidum]|uniref:Uncharacterized protein n=1 Tax=Melastoma candidum TaxID=119954 RepID=A0ACB9S826_9MYRT|nr:hypothetical protein MLD38_005142 [Melastoma candidum]
MGRMEYIAMKTDEASGGSDLIDGGMSFLQVAADEIFGELSKHKDLGFGTHFLKWIASFAAIYLLVLDRTNWRTNMLTALLVPYIFFTLPSAIFHLLRWEVGKWIAFVAVILRLFFPRHFPEFLEIPGLMILLLVAAPDFIAVTLKDSWVSILICLLIGCFLLQEHIRATGGFHNSITEPHGLSNTAGIILLMVYPVWALLGHFIMHNH